MIEKIASERGMDGSISVESSGTGAWHVGENADGRMRRTARRHGLDLHHLARRVTTQDLAESDLLIAMSPGHLRDLRSLASRARIEVDHKLYLLRQFDPELGAHEGEYLDASRVPEVPDPYYGGDQGFEDVYAIVERSATLLLDHIAAGGLP